MASNASSGLDRAVPAGSDVVTRTKLAAKTQKSEWCYGSINPARMA